MLLKGVEGIVKGRWETLMETLTNDLGGWTSDELLTEVLERSAADRPALRLLQGMILRALLAEGDRQYADSV